MNKPKIRFNKEVFRRPVKTERVGPNKYLEILKSEQDNINHVRFIPGPLGSRSIGTYEVEYDIPVLREMPPIEIQSYD